MLCMLIFPMMSWVELEVFPFECNEVFFRNEEGGGSIFEKNKNEPLSSERSRECNLASVNYDVCLHRVTKVKNFYFW